MLMEFFNIGKSSSIHKQIQIFNSSKSSYKLKGYFVEYFGMFEIYGKMDFWPGGISKICDGRLLFLIEWCLLLYHPGYILRTRTSAKDRDSACGGPSSHLPKNHVATSDNMEGKRRVAVIPSRELIFQVVLWTKLWALPGGWRLWYEDVENIHFGICD